MHIKKKAIRPAKPHRGQLYHNTAIRTPHFFWRRLLGLLSLYPRHFINSVLRILYVNYFDKQVSYEIALPKDNPPGWGVGTSRRLDDQHFIHIGIQASLPPQPGAHRIQLKAILKWETGQDELTRDVDWVSSGDTEP